MKNATKITAGVASLVVVGGLAIAGVAAITVLGEAAHGFRSAASTPQSPASEPVVPEPSPEPTRWPLPADQVVSELPGWAQNPGQVWIIYPQGMKCHGTEGCPNSFRHLIGEPSWPLPANVEYYGGPTTQEWLRQGVGAAVPGHEGTWSEADLRHLTELGYSTQLPVPVP